MDTFDVINKRRSIRNYSDEDISDDELKKVLETGKIAPKAGPTQITVIKNKEVLGKIGEVTVEALKNSGNEGLEKLASTPGFDPTFGAPVLVVVSAPIEDPYGSINGSLAAENIILAATDLGLGSCYMLSPTFAFLSPKKEELIKDIELPEGFVPVASIILGKIGEDYADSPREDVDNINYVL